MGNVVILKRAIERHLYADRKEGGFCVQCPYPPSKATAGLLCAEHRVRSKGYRKLKIARGLCQSCPRPAVKNRASCRHHLRLRRYRHLKARYGLTQAAYLEMAQAQGWRCAICGKKRGSRGIRGKGLVVDHDHSNKRVRALLCDPCNRIIAFAHERVAHLEAAIAYLRKHFQ